MGVHSLFLEVTHQTGTSGCLWSRTRAWGSQLHLFNSIPSACHYLFKNVLPRGAWLAQTEELATLDLRVVSSSPALGIEMT